MCIVKPDAVLAGLTDRVLGAAEDDGFYVVRRAEKRLTPARARAFYQHLEGTNAFRPAAEFLASGPVVVAVLSKVDAVRAWRERVGPTDPDVARELHPKSIRAQLGVDAHAVAALVRGVAELLVRRRAARRGSAHRGRRRRAADLGDRELRGHPRAVAPDRPQARAERRVDARSGAGSVSNVTTSAVLVEIERGGGRFGVV